MIIMYWLLVITLLVIGYLALRVQDLKRENYLFINGWTKGRKNYKHYIWRHPRDGEFYDLRGAYLKETSIPDDYVSDVYTEKLGVYTEEKEILAIEKALVEHPELKYLNREAYNWMDKE
jgi:hypothetical protein